MEGDVSSIIRIGQVSSVNPAYCSCRVAFDDLDESVSFDFPVLQPRTVERKDFTLPEVGEHVVCVSLPNGIEEGFVIGSYYTNSNLPKGAATGVYRTEYSDGTVIEYDLNEHRATVRSEHFVEVEAREVTIKAENINITGKVNIEGDVAVTGDVRATEQIVAGAISLRSHVHGGVQGGISTSGGPQ